MDNEKIELYINESQVELAKQSARENAKHKLIFTILSVFITVFVTYTSELVNVLLLITVLIFICPFYIDSKDTHYFKNYDQKIHKVFRCIIFIVSIILVIRIIASQYEIGDFLGIVDVILKLMIYMTLIIIFCFSLYLFTSISYNEKEHIALAIVEKRARESRKDKRMYQQDMKNKHQKDNRDFIKEHSYKKNKRSD